MSLLPEILVLIKGAGDLGSGVAARLHRSGFSVVMTELENPLMVRRKVCFGEAVYGEVVEVEGIYARCVADVASALALLAQREIPVLVDPVAACRRELHPLVLIDAIMAKQNTGTSINDAPIVIGLGPGFTASIDCHAIVETCRGHQLGRAIWHGTALPDTGVPGEIAGNSDNRILRSPANGEFIGLADIGDSVVRNQVVARVGSHEVVAGCDGILRGLLRSGLLVTAGIKIGDVDPRAQIWHCNTISDKALSVAGGVLEAILACLANDRGDPTIQPTWKPDK